MSPRRLHVVVPGPIDQQTGGYIYDRRMVEGLRARGWRVDVHSLAGTFPTDDAGAGAGLAAALAGLPDGERVLIDGLALGGLPGPVHAERTRLRILALVHHPLADETGLDAARRARLEALEREALAACAGVLVTSDFTARRLEAYGVAPARVRAVRPGTDPAPLADGPEPGDPPLLLSVGSVTPRKGQRVLAAALARLDDLSWRCVCAGSLERDPGYAAEVTAFARETGLGDRLRFAGECGAAELDRLYHRATLFVLPSYYEGYGMALADALARGLPVVSTTGGAIPHTVPADAGVLVAPGDEAALAGALRASARRAGRRRAPENPGGGGTPPCRRTGGLARVGEPVRGGDSGIDAGLMTSGAPTGGGARRRVGGCGSDCRGQELRDRVACPDWPRSCSAMVAAGPALRRRLSAVRGPAIPIRFPTGANDRRPGSARDHLERARGALPGPRAGDGAPPGRGRTGCPAEDAPGRWPET